MGRWLQQPLARGLDLDDPRTTAVRREVLRRKRFLRRLYEDWYADLRAAVPAGDGAVVELGSGAGFLADSLPRLVRSEVFFCPWVEAVLDAQRLPFAARSLRAVLMINVLHHLPDASAFFSDAARAVRPDGVVAMVEPWNTPWSRLVYTRLHHEPFLPAASEWGAGPGGPLSGANSALPWILFHRDRDRFAAVHPQWSLETVRPMMPVRYLLSGGVGMRSFMPGFAYAPWRALERGLDGLSRRAAMFAHVVLRRRDD
jgi:SAM-dependent methyltransferase